MRTSQSAATSWGHSRAPLSRPSDDRPPHDTPMPTHEAPIRVLIVSDLLLGRAGLHYVLREAPGIALVGEVATCEDGIDLAARERPNVILIDVDLRSDAFRYVGQIVAAAPDSRVIALTDRTHAADHQALIELGVTGLVLKNEGPEVLIKAIRKVHGGEVWLDRTITARVLTGAARRRHVRDIEAEKIASLTRREHEIIALVGEGLKNAAIADRLFVSEATVRNHLTSILSKLDLSDRFELAVYAFRHGLVRYPDA